MNPGRFKKADVKADVQDTPADVKADVQDTPADVKADVQDTPADVQDTPKAGELDSVSEALLNEIPNRPKKATPKADVPADVQDMPADVQDVPAARKPHGLILASVAALTLGGLAVALNRRPAAAAAQPGAAAQVAAPAGLPVSVPGALVVK